MEREEGCSHFCRERVEDSSFYLITYQTWTDLIMMPHVRIPRRVPRTRLGFEHSDWLFGKLSFMKLSECILLDRMSVLPPKLAHIWVFLPSGAKKMQTLLQPSASGESAFFWLLQARIPRREPPSAAGLLQTCHRL